MKKKNPRHPTPSLLPPPHYPHPLTPRGFFQKKVNNAVVNKMLLHS